MAVRTKIKGGKRFRRVITEKKKLMQSLDILVVAGIPRESRNTESGESIPVYGAQNEFGVPSQNIPERSFLRSTLEEQDKEYKDGLNQIAEGVIKRGKSARQGAGLLGVKIEADIKTKILTLKTPPNSPYTLERKNGSNPLIDTGSMKDSIKFEIRNKDKKNA